MSSLAIQGPQNLGRLLPYLYLINVSGARPKISSGQDCMMLECFVSPADSTSETRGGYGECIPSIGVKHLV